MPVWTHLRQPVHWQCCGCHWLLCAGMEIKLVVYRTPVRAGSCYVFYNNITRGASPEFKAKTAANKRSALETHLSMLRFFVSLCAAL